MHVISDLADPRELPYHSSCMRQALLSVVTLGLGLGTPSLASAENLPTVVYGNRVHRVPDGATPLASISHTLYLNNCLPNGCALLPGFDDSRTNHSSIAQGNVTLSAWPHGDPKWQQLVQCVKDTFLPFSVDVVTTDPGSASHFEVMVAGTALQLNSQLTGAGGVAPFIGCGATENNVTSFVFAQLSGDLNYLCGAVAQEAAHVWGLDHELNADDPMTYLNLGSLKRFQNAAAQCGENAGQPRACNCGGTTQNSYTYMLQTFGAANLPPATLSIATPTDGQWVKPGFPVRAQLTSVITGLASGSLSIDGAQVTSVAPPNPLAFNAPATISGGEHTVTVNGTDAGGRMAIASVKVKVTAACSASAPCATGQSCLGGFCLPGADVAGGLGATCTANDACITGQCGNADGTQLCTSACDAGNVCPAGFDCLGTSGGAAGVCWPSSDDGGCATGGSSGGAPALLLAGLGCAAIMLRRRR